MSKELTLPLIATAPQMPVVRSASSAWQVIASTLAVVTVSAAAVTFLGSMRQGQQIQHWTTTHPLPARVLQLKGAPPMHQPKLPGFTSNAAAGTSGSLHSATANDLHPQAQPVIGFSLPGSSTAFLLLGLMAGALGQLYVQSKRSAGSSSSLPMLPMPFAPSMEMNIANGAASVPSMAMFSTTSIRVEPKTKTHETVPYEALGYEFVKKEFLKEYNSEAVLYRHKKTGAEVLSMANNDENKVFGITFRTTPTDSTGLPHILEHSVLCGSRKYPVKEPFVELLKGSLNTFLNAMTFPDKTCYPVASCNLQDFYNLVDVYLDAVFYPNITPETLMQEGHHLEADHPDDAFTYKGVVFNEMKGVYSQPDAIHGRVCQASLFPDPQVTYSVDSGGDPQVIPNLTFQQYSHFHQHFYHPSNSRIFFYGDDDLEKRLTILNEYLNAFEPLDHSQNKVQYQSKFSEPRKVVDYYAASQDAGPGGKSFLSVNWVMNWERMDDVEELALSLLNDMILGSKAAPLRRALDESGLGSSVIGGGVDTGLLQATFSIGMKNVKNEDTDTLEQLILGTLKKIADEGFTKEQIEASINSTEFAMRELNTGGFPRGIAIMLGALQHWVHDRDPIEPLKFEKPLATLKERLAAGEDVFTPLIRKYLLDNTHRVTVAVHPDSDLGEQLERKEAERLADIKKAMSPEDIQNVIAMKKMLQEKQETPDDPEALKCVPTLKVSDIEKENKTVPTAISTVKDATLLYHDIFTNNILYLDMAFDLHALPQDLVPYLPLFIRALSEFGTKKEDFVSLTQRIKRKVGGISKSVMVSPVLHQRGTEVAHLIVRGKGTADQLPELADILSDILLEPEFNDQQKFRQMILESKAGLEAALVGAGHRIAGGRLSAMDNTSAFISEQMGGLSYLTFLNDLLKKVDNDWTGVVATLERMRQLIVNRRNLVVNVTADAPLMGKFTPVMENFVGRLPLVDLSAFKWDGTLERVNEGIIVPTQVNYVAKAANIYDAGYKYHGSVNVINKYLGTTWLWDRVRVVGGAYGAFCSFDRLSGNFSYGSYRDPNLLSTLEVYDGTANFLRALDLNDDALNKAIIGAIGDFDSYQLPDAKGYSALTRYLVNVSDADRQLTRDQILGTTRQNFKEFADYVEAVKNTGTVVVVGSEGDFQKADSNATLFGRRLNPLGQE